MSYADADSGGVNAAEQLASYAHPVHCAQKGHSTIIIICYYYHVLQMTIIIHFGMLNTTKQRIENKI